MFSADLLRHIKHKVEIDFLNLSSYGAGTESSGTVTLLNELRTPCKGRHVVLCDDLMDSGLTLEWAKNYILEQEPASLKTVCLMNKAGRRHPSITWNLDYVGFECPNEFIVGYGCDFAEQWRSPPYICVLKPSAYKK